MKTEAESSTTDTKSAEAKPKLPPFETLGLLLLSLATVGTAWCSYQAAAWGGTAGGKSDGRRAVNGGQQKMQQDPHWRDYLQFYEYFQGDNGAGIGASHQTGWTGVIARAMHLFATTSAEQVLQMGKMAAAVDAEKSDKSSLPQSRKSESPVCPTPATPRSTRSTRASG